MQNTSSILTRAFAVWLVIIGAETVHGILRVLFLEPYFGDKRARQIAVFSGALIILTISFLFIRWIPAKNNFQLLLAGFFWVVLTLAFEISFGLFLMNLSWERVSADYDILQGGLLPFGLLVMFFSPWIAARARENLHRKKG